MSRNNSAAIPSLSEKSSPLSHTSARQDPNREFELLLCIARKSMDAASAERLTRILRQPVRWDSVLRAAARHGLAPLLFAHLKHNSCEVPASILKRLELLNRDNARRNLMLTGKLFEILELLNSRGFSAIPFKGPALGLSVYGDLTTRTSFDLDILVQDRDVLCIGALLESQGFRPEIQLTPRRTQAFLRSQCELNFNRDEDLIHLEVHWAITPHALSLPLDLSVIWRNPGYVKIGNQSLPVLPPEVELLVLCIHGSKHLWERLLLICDVAELIRARPALDWQRIQQLAEASGSHRLLFLGLHLAGEWLSAPLPKEIRQHMFEDRQVTRLAQEVRRQYDRDAVRTAWDHYRFLLRTSEGWQNRAAIVRRLAMEPGPGDWQQLPLPDALFPVYYLLRPIRLVAQHGAFFWRN